MKETTTCTVKRFVCASETTKLIGSLTCRFEDFGHHLENEMGGLWLHPIKLLDGFWMHFEDHSDTAKGWLLADSYTAHPYGSEFHFRASLGHTPVTVDLLMVAPEDAAGVILKYHFINRGEARDLSLRFLARTDLRAVWNGEASGMIDGVQDDVQYLSESSAFLGKDSDNEWYVMFGASETPVAVQSGNIFGPDHTQGAGTSGAMDFKLHLKQNEEYTLMFYISGSYLSSDDCIRQYDLLRNDTDYIAAKKQHMSKIQEKAGLTVADKNFTNIYTWIKYNTHWLIQRNETGRGITAGIPEYPWWFGCDSCYAIQGILCMGEQELAYDTLELLLNSSQKDPGDGRIVHEITTDGSVYHPGNTQETAHFFVALWMYFEWTGDIEFVKRAIPYLKKSIEWLKAQDDDGDLFPSGYGIIEIAGLNLELIDSAVYTAAAYEIYGKLLKLLGDPDGAKSYFNDAALLKEKINTFLWDDDEGLYCDCFASGQAITSRVEEILKYVPTEKRSQAEEFISKKLQNKPKEEESGWILNKNWVINTPMEMRIAPVEQADRALSRMHTSEFIGRYGMYLSAMNQREIMTIPTGVMAAAQVRYGYADRGLELIHLMFDSFGMSTPGSISEMSPDYGCFVQAWTAYAAFVPVVTGFFGIEPSFSEGIIRISPCMPNAWPDATLDNLPMMNGQLSISYERKNNQAYWMIDNQTDYPICFVYGDTVQLNRGQHELQLPFVNSKDSNI